MCEPFIRIVCFEILRCKLRIQLIFIRLWKYLSLWSTSYWRITCGGKHFYAPAPRGISFPISHIFKIAPFFLLWFPLFGKNLFVCVISCNQKSLNPIGRRFSVTQWKQWLLSCVCTQKYRETIVLLQTSKPWRHFKVKLINSKPTLHLTCWVPLCLVSRDFRLK